MDPGDRVGGMQTRVCPLFGIEQSNPGLGSRALCSCGGERDLEERAGRAVSVSIRVCGLHASCSDIARSGSFVRSGSWSPNPNFPPANEDWCALLTYSLATHTQRSVSRLSILHAACCMLSPMKPGIWPFSSSHRRRPVRDATCTGQGARHSSSHWHLGAM
eukprot:scaffold9342_cov126-Isochrysis_galbana.AAC.7